MEEAVADARKEAQISTTYILSPYLKGLHLNVAVQGGKAELTGQVADEVHKELAGDIAAGVEGVTSVDNRIVVDINYGVLQSSKTSGYAEVVSDVEISAAIKAKLIWSKYADDMDITVTAKAGKVTLKGKVATMEMQELAEKLARDTRGVYSIKNKLVVTDMNIERSTLGNQEKEEDIRIADSWITTKVKLSLLYSRSVAGTDVGVTTGKGIVKLTGRVSSGAERALAIELAEFVRGVKSVDSGKLVC